MSLKAEYKKGIVVLGVCVLGCILLAMLVYFSGKLPEFVQGAILFALIICFMVVVFRANQKRDYLSFGRGVESESAYSILGVTIKASGKEIRQAYRAMAGKHHPDNYPEDQKATATALLLRINRAYEMIGDEDARFEYDALMRFHDPSAPPFDEAYAHIHEWRSKGGGDYGDVEYWGNALGSPDQEYTPESNSHDEESAGPMSSIPEPIVIASSQEIQQEEPMPTPQSAPSSSGECHACGEQYLVPQGTSGSIFCERCGEEITRAR